ncbi:MAG: hypothetical protein E6R03_16265 [Hyphomicrobiaceae bacterium]|nr:MAG: hypothetical protein E6R03_16265 [Hyphomicrobiaceae bacterium]
MEFSAGLPKQGQTWYGTQLTEPTSPNTVPSGSSDQVTQLEGARATFRPISKTITNGIRNVLPGGEQLAILVRNSSGGALLPGQLVNWSSGYIGRRVGAKATAAAASNAGIVDPYLPSAGVADGDLFWLFRSGPVYVRMVAATFAVSDIIVASATAGSCNKKGSAYAFGDIGFCQEAVETAAGDLVLTILKLEAYS